MWTWIKNTIAVKTAQAKFEQERMSLAVKQLESASNIYALADPDEADWNTLGSMGSENKEIRTEEEVKRSRTQSRKFYRFNPHGKSIIRNLCKFVIGKGVRFIPNEKAKTKKKRVLEVWKKFVELNKFLNRQKEIVTRAFRDGEVFLRIFVLNGKEKGYLALRFVDPDDVATPDGTQEQLDADNRTKRGTILTYGIEHNPDDIEDIKGYWVNDKLVPAVEIIHIKLLADSDQKRGIPFMEAVLPDITNYRNWLKDRIILNKIRTAIALIRKIPPGIGTPAQVGDIRGNAQASVRNLKSSKLQSFEPGTILTTRGVEYEFISPNLEARDSSQDGRNILLSVSSGVGMPEYMITADSSNANYSSTMVAESPAVKEFEDWQDFFGYYFKLIFKMQMELAVKTRVLSVGTETDCEIEFPTLTVRDIQKESRSYSLMREHGVISIKTWRGRSGLDHEIEQENMTTEMAGELILPPLPKNQGPEEPSGGDKSDDEKPDDKKKADKKKLVKKKGGDEDA